MASSTKDKLLETAVRLFSQHGYHATGIDRIIAESGVSKKTLYNHFKSKDELILSALRRWDEDSRLWLMRAMEKREKDPRRRLLALFDVLDDWFVSQNFFGCMFINATAEYADPENPIHAAAAEHKRVFRVYLRDLALKAGAANPDELVAQLALLMEGAIVTSQFTNNTRAGAQAKSAAMTIMDQAFNTVLEDEQ